MNVFSSDLHQCSCDRIVSAVIKSIDCTDLTCKQKFINYANQRQKKETARGPFSSAEATILLVSTKNRDLWFLTSGWNQFVEHAQSTRSIFSANQICQIWRLVRDSRTSGFGTGQRSRFLVLIKRIVASGDENARGQERMIYKEKDFPKHESLSMIIFL